MVVLLSPNAYISTLYARHIRLACGINFDCRSISLHTNVLTLAGAFSSFLTSPFLGLITGFTIIRTRVIFAIITIHRSI